jgi:hypothetical protein
MKDVFEDAQNTFLANEEYKGGKTELKTFNTQPSISIPQSV